MALSHPTRLIDVLERMVSGRTKANELERLLPWISKPADPFPSRGKGMLGDPAS